MCQHHHSAAEQVPAGKPRVRLTWSKLPALPPTPFQYLCFNYSAPLPMPSMPHSAQNQKPWLMELANVCTTRTMLSAMTQRAAGWSKHAILAHARVHAAQVSTFVIQLISVERWRIGRRPTQPLGNAGFNSQGEPPCLPHLLQLPPTQLCLA